MLRFRHEDLLDFAAQVLRELAVPDQDAALVADSLVRADLWGHQSHGLLRLPWYVARLRSGVMKPVTSPELVVDGGAVAVVDGHDGVGQVITAYAAREGIRRARRHGVAAVGVRNSNHFGTAAYFTRMAPPEGCIALLTTNSSPAMAPWGGREKVIGSNPWSLATPAGAGRISVMDVSNTVVARGKIYLANQRAASIPPDWAITADGRPTTDPAAALAGTILPMGQHKGYVISMMMDVLSGVLTGSGFGTGVAGPYQDERPGRAGHLYLALDVARFLPLAEFEQRMTRLIDELKSVPLAEGFEEILYPGELEARAEQRGLRDGLRLPDRTLADLAKLAEEFDLPFAPREVPARPD
jgi:LDH2 family malate/lactate/ureidoglycolate dehydrogenase